VTRKDIAADDRDRRRPPDVKATAIVLGLVLGAACAGPVAGLDPPRAAESAVPIWIVAHGWHAGIAVRARDVPAALWPERRDLARAEYLEVGWGDRDYWQAEDPGLGLALNALLVPTPSVVRLIGIETPLPAAFPGAEIIEIGLSPAAFERLLRFVDQTFARAGAEPASPLGTVSSPHVRFYAAHGRYHLFRTSNTWTARALREAGLPTTPALALTAGGVLRQARRHGVAVSSDADAAGRRLSP
jgi:uncharacterized protein (TIGR02117 family)